MSMENEKRKVIDILKDISVAATTNNIDEIVKQAQKIAPELIEMLQKENPEYVTAYLWRLQHLAPEYPDSMRLHNAYEIIYTYLRLKTLEFNRK